MLFLMLLWKEGGFLIGIGLMSPGRRARDKGSADTECAFSPGCDAEGDGSRCVVVDNSSDAEAECKFITGDPDGVVDEDPHADQDRMCQKGSTGGIKLSHYRSGSTVICYPYMAT